MGKAAKVNFSVEDFTQTVSSPLDGISFVLGRSVRGPFADPSEIINNWPKFVEMYGGLSDSSDAPLIARRILEKGGSIRFSRVGHYTDPADPGTLDAVRAQQSPVVLYEIDAPFITGNQIDMTINGDSITTVPFSVDSNTTFENLATAVKASPHVSDAVVIVPDSGNATNMFIMPAPGVTLNITASTITGGASQAVDSQTDMTDITDGDGNSLFGITLKDQGADGNNFRITIGPASNGSADYFKLTVEHAFEKTIKEVYDNLYINGNKTASTSTYLKDIVDGSSFINVVYKDHQTFTGQLVPVKGFAFSFTGGTNGTTPADADYIGDSAGKTGFHAFDSYDDALEMVALDKDSDAVNIAGAAYAANRADLQYIVHLPITLKSKSALIAKRDTLGITTKYAYIVSGGITIFDPITSQKVNKSEVGDILAVAANSARNYGPWFSFAGPNRGVLSGILGVVNNFGSPASYQDLDDLANKQINMVITRNGKSMLWGNYSAQLENNQEKFNNIVRLVIYLKKSLKPTLESFLEEPNDIPTWKRIFYTIKPFLDSMVTRRAIYSYEWVGDQDATSFNNLIVNNSVDVSNGIYKANLVIGAIPGINEINISIILTRAGVSFSDISDLS